jgi:NAD(P)-dependent dehydrogenase (short-subunit alcohol dehydrogenase family)
MGYKRPRGDSRPRLSGRAKLSGKVALVTGASQGLGFAIANALAAEGCNLTICSRKEATLNRAAKKLAQNKVRVLSVVCDVRNPEAVQALFVELKRRFRRLDILINNAGISHANFSVARFPADKWKEVIGTNLTGLFYVTRAALPLMKRGGAIVSNLSIAAKKIFPGSAAYAASKHGALALTTSLREELRPTGIRVIALLPGATHTAIWNQFWPDAPRKKMMRPATVAQAVVNALTLPEEATVEELTILPSAGVL